VIQRAAPASTCWLTARVDFRIERGAVARLVIDRVAKRNALTRAMWEALPELLAELAGDDEVKVLLVTGEGPSFSAGADIRELISGDDPADPMAELRAFNLRAQAALREFPKPTIAVVRGHCIGGGLEIALGCDFRIVADTAKLGLPEIQLGVIPGGGGTQRLARLVGPAIAKNLLYTGRQVGAEEAARIGLVDEVVPADRTLDRAKEFAASLSGGPALALRAAKLTVDEGLDQPLETGLALERSHFLALFGTEDRTIGMQSFRENGPGKANFVGR